MFKAFRVVRKSEVQKVAQYQADAVDRCLECWKYYMSSQGTGDLAMKTMTGLKGLSDAYGIETGEAQLKRDIEVGAATGAMIDSLSRLHQWSIWKTVGMGQVWNFPNADIIATFDRARWELELKLRRNICTSTLF